MSQWRRPLAIILAAAVALVVLMILSGMGPNVALVLSLTILVGSGYWVVSDLLGITFGSEGLSTAEAPPPVAGADRRVTRLRIGLAYGRYDDGSLERLRASLVELIDDQLLAVHSIDRSVDPAAADEVLGDELSEFVRDPATARRLDTPRLLAHTVTLIERL